MEVFAVLLILLIVIPILAVLSISIAPIFYTIGILVILGGFLFSIDSEHKGAIITTCLIIGIALILIGASVDGQRVYDLLSYCVSFFR